MTKLIIEFDLQDNSRTDDSEICKRVEEILNVCVKHNPTSATIADTWQERYNEIVEYVKKVCLFPLDFYVTFDEKSQR